ncbi:hypothetical protein C5S36_05670, partial [Candidatus Methanophagaceae archaeon]
SITGLKNMERLSTGIKGLDSLIQGLSERAGDSRHGRVGRGKDNFWIAISDFVL